MKVPITTTAAPKRKGSGAMRGDEPKRSAMDEEEAEAQTTSVTDGEFLVIFF